MLFEVSMQLLLFAPMVEVVPSRKLKRSKNLRSKTEIRGLKLPYIPYPPSCTEASLPLWTSVLTQIPVREVQNDVAVELVIGNLQPLACNLESVSILGNCCRKRNF